MSRLCIRHLERSLYFILTLTATLPACSDPETLAKPADDSAPPEALPPMRGPTEISVPADYWPHAIDRGVVDSGEGFRALLVFPIRDEEGLKALINDLYTPGSAQFRRYLSAEEWIARFAPPQADVDAVQQWIEAHGMKVARVAKNRLMLEYTGTVGQWNATFGAELHRVQRSDETRYDPAFAPLGELQVPEALYGKIKRLLMPNPALDSRVLPPDTLTVTTTQPSNVASCISPSQLARAVGVSSLHARGFKGAGMTLGIIAATTFRTGDIQSMWQSFGIKRKNPIKVDTMEPQQVRDMEATGDVELAALLAPEADIIFYSGPDNSDTTLVYTFNEAIGMAQAQVLSDSFAHSEYNSPSSVSRTYDESAMMAAAVGMTVVSSSGDSAQPDTPSNAPYVTSVGGTELTMDSDGTWRGEVAWTKSGCGLSRVFALPAWQQAINTGSKYRRAIADLSLVQGPYWIMYQAQWSCVGGTSTSSAVMAGLLTAVNHARKAQGKPPLGFLNPLIYQDAATRNSFRDITAQGQGGGGCDVATGYDRASGIGSVRASELAAAMP